MRSAKPARLSSLSQAHEGWELVNEQYDDGGWSGGNMADRPSSSSWPMLPRAESMSSSFTRSIG